LALLVPVVSLHNPVTHFPHLLRNAVEPALIIWTLGMMTWTTVAHIQRREPEGDPVGTTTLLSGTTTSPYLPRLGRSKAGQEAAAAERQEAEEGSGGEWGVRKRTTVITIQKTTGCIPQPVVEVRTIKVNQVRINVNISSILALSIILCDFV
jgi:hypothetical protein